MACLSFFSVRILVSYGCVMYAQLLDNFCKQRVPSLKLLHLVYTISSVVWFEIVLAGVCVRQPVSVGVVAMIASFFVRRDVVKRIAGVALAFGLALALPAVAFAADAGGDTSSPAMNLSDVSIVKHVQASPEAPISNDTFSFSFTPVGCEDDEGAIISGSAANMGTIPNLVSKKVSEGTSTDGGYNTDITTSGIQFPTNWPHAGVWQYQVAEVGANQTHVEVNGNQYKPSQASYIMRVYVENVDGGLRATKVTLAGKTEDVVSGDEGTAGWTEGDKVESMEFTNRYDKQAGLVIRKSVDGAYGDKTKPFLFTVKLTVPPELMHEITTTTAGVGPEGVTVPSVPASGANTSGETSRHFLFGFSKVRGAADSTAVALENQPNVAIISGIQLADGGSLSFGNVLPVGTRYEVIETGEAGYTASGVTYANSGATTQTSAQPQAGTAGADYTVASGANTAVTPDGAALVVTNTYRAVTPTGILMDNLPYLLMLGMPVAAFAAWFVNRRRKMVA